MRTTTGRPSDPPEGGDRHALPAGRRANERGSCARPAGDVRRDRPGAAGGRPDAKPSGQTGRRPAGSRGSQVPAPRPVAAEYAAASLAAAGRPRPARTHPADQAGGHLADQAGALPADMAGGPPPDKEVSRWRSLDETGNVRILPVSRQTRPPEPPARSAAHPARRAQAAERPAAAPAPPEPEIIPPAAAEPIAAEPSHG